VRLPLALRLACLVAAGALAGPLAWASPHGFEANHGQADGRVRFLARGRGYRLFLTGDEAVLDFAGGRTPLRLRPAGARPAALRGEGPLPGRSHYFAGQDPGRWVVNVPSFERVRYEAVYPGVDLVFHEREGRLEYDFEVGPGQDPGRVALEVSGARSLRIDAEGRLVLATREGEVVWRKPVAYQLRGSERLLVESRYVRRGRRRVGFAVGAYDRSRPLVIDPVLAYSTHLGGGGADAGHAIAADAAGNAYVAGETASLNFPGTGSLRGPTDAFVTKLDPTGAIRLYSVYLGGSGNEVGRAVAVDAAGNATVAGETDSSDFPATAGAFQGQIGEGRDGFVARLDAAGMLTYATYLGGTGMDQGDRISGIALDAAGNAVVVGRTDSDDFPTTPGVLFPTFRGLDFDGFVAKLDPRAAGPASLLFSTFLGGSRNDAAFGVAVDAAGNIHVAGGTNSADFPAGANAYQPSSTAGSTDAFYTRLDAAAASVLYSTFLGGSASNERANGVALDAAGRAVVVGQTEAADFPTKNALQATLGGPIDAFVAKFDPSASGDASLLYSTFLGGSGIDTARAVAVDAGGQTYVTGQTGSNGSFPISNAVQATYGGGAYDAYVTKLDAAGTARLYSTYLGGSDTEGTAATQQGGHGIALVGCGDALVTGRTVSADFPRVGPAQPAAGGLGDAFVARIDDPDAPTVAGVVPRWGPATGGAVVNVVGTCFRPGAAAAFGGLPAVGVSVLGPNLLSATTPAHAPGAVDVAVTNPSLPPATAASAYTYGAAGFFTLPPCRLVDTRGSPGPRGGPALAANSERTFAVTGTCGIPADAGALSVNLTSSEASAPGHFRLYPGGTALPLVSSVNYASGQTRANNATVPLGPGGTIRVRCVQASGAVHFILDVNGYFR
jgi:hypothetical protein